jgi:hypothetical protein
LQTPFRIVDHDWDKGRLTLKLSSPAPNLWKQLFPVNRVAMCMRSMPQLPVGTPLLRSPYRLMKAVPPRFTLGGDGGFVLPDPSVRNHSAREMRSCGHFGWSPLAQSSVKVRLKYTPL